MLSRGIDKKIIRREEISIYPISSFKTRKYYFFIGPLTVGIIRNYKLSSASLTRLQAAGQSRVVLLRGIDKKTVRVVLL